MSDDFLEEFHAEDESFPGYSNEEAERGEVLQFEGEVAVGKLINGLVHIVRSGVPNGENRVRACGFAV